MRTQWCREHADQLVEKCGMSLSEAIKSKTAVGFCKEHPAFMDCATNTIIAITKISDSIVKNKTIADAERILRIKKPDGVGFLREKLSLREIQAIISKYESVSTGKRVKKPKTTTKVSLTLEQKELDSMRMIIDGGYATTIPDAVKVAILWANVKLTENTTIR
jgi:hypothetical protein